MHLCEHVYFIHFIGCFREPIQYYEFERSSSTSGMLILSVLLCICAVYVSGLTLKVLNDKYVSTLMAGETIFTELSFDASFATVDIISDSKVCLLINGDVCTCYDQVYGELVVTMAAACYFKLEEASNASPIAWLSLQLHVPPNANNIHAPSRIIVSTAVPIQLKAIAEDTAHNINNMITLVLPLTIDDMSRASVLLNSLKHISAGTVHELLVFVPDAHVVLMTGALQGMAEQLQLTFPVVVHSELLLFWSNRAQLQQVYPYALQMAIKLLAAQIVKTPYYVTLDADIVLLRPLQIDKILVSVYDGGAPPTGDAQSAETTHKRALYHFEERAVHENWWRGSERLLGIDDSTSYVYHSWKHSQPGSTCSNDGTGECTATQEQKQGFGVTPAVLSTYGSLLTVSHLCRQLLHSHAHEAHANSLTSEAVDATSSVKYGDQEPVDREQCERLWLDGFGRPVADEEGAAVMLWSEYTLYRIVLDHVEVFDELHIREEDAALSQSTADSTASVEAATAQLTTLLHCHNVWYASQLPWRADLAHDTLGCLFSVIQSSTGVSPSSVLRLYERFFP